MTCPCPFCFTVQEIAGYVAVNPHANQPEPPRTVRCWSCRKSFTPVPVPVVKEEE